MKKKLCILAFVSAGFMSIAQVGINTGSPQATLDVTGVPGTKTKLDGIIAPRLTGNQLRDKNYTAAQTGAIVYVTVADSAPAGQTINVNSSGYYYFDGAEWSGLGTNWHTEGNHSTVTPVATLGNDIAKGNYLGTSDDRNLVIATKKNVKAILDLEGNLTGGNNNVSGPYASFSWGSNNKLNNYLSANVAIGKDNTVSALGGNFPGVAIGSGNDVSNGGKALGNTNTVNAGATSFVVGNGNTLTGTTSVVVGNSNTSKGGLTIGATNNVDQNSIAIGSGNTAMGFETIAVGFGAQATEGAVFAASKHAFFNKNNGTNTVVGINMIPTTTGSTSGAAIQMKGFAAAGDAPCTVAEEGAIRYNSTTKKHEGCNGTKWNALYP